MARSKRPQFAADVAAATGGEVKRIMPSHIRADHSRNTSRWACYDAPEELRDYFDGAKICFTLAQIEQRLKSLLAEGQITPVDISISNTRHPDLVSGFLRHCAFLLAEVRGVLDQIPNAKGRDISGIRAQVVPAPKTQADHAAISRRNFAENQERKDLTPVDLAFHIKHKLASFDDDGNTPTRVEVAEELNMSKRSVDRYVQLTSLRPAILLAVHEGKMKMSAALADASKKGEGTSRGSNPGIRRAAMRRRKPERRPAVTLQPEQLDELIDVLNGDRGLTEETDAEGKITPAVADEVRAWVEYLNAPTEPKPSKPRKKAPPKAGAKKDPN